MYVCVTVFRCVHFSSIQQCSLGAAVIFTCNEQTCRTRHAFTDKEEWHLKVTFLWAQQKTITGTSYMCVCTQVQCEQHICKVAAAPVLHLCQTGGIQAQNEAVFSHTSMCNDHYGRENNRKIISWSCFRLDTEDELCRTAGPITKVHASTRGTFTAAKFLFSAQICQ